MKFKSDHVAFKVSDLAVSRAFYEYLGGCVVSKPSPNFVEVMLGDLRLHLVKAHDAKGPPKSQGGIDHLCLSVPTVRDLVLLCERINEHPDVRAYAPFAVEESEMLGQSFKGHAEERPPLKTLYIKDPDGISIEIRSYQS